MRITASTNVSMLGTGGTIIAPEDKRFGQELKATGAGAVPVFHHCASLEVSSDLNHSLQNST